MSDDLICAFGEPWMGPHPKCEAEGDRLEVEFWAAVARGEYDEDGYTPFEANERQRALQAAGRLF